MSNKLELTVALVIGASAVIFAKTGYDLVKQRKEKAKIDHLQQWFNAYEKADALPYYGRWTSGNATDLGAWDSIHLDENLKIGSIYSCYGPTGCKAVIVVTALYGPLAIVNYQDQLVYVGHPKLALIKHAEVQIFTNPLPMEWLGSILDPQSEIYGTAIDSAWGTLYDTATDAQALNRTVRNMERKVEALATELAEKAVTNRELRTALTVCQESCGSSMHSFVDLQPNANGTFITTGFMLPEVDVNAAIITWIETIEVLEDMVDVDITLTDPEDINAIENSFREAIC